MALYVHTDVSAVALVDNTTAARTTEVAAETAAIMAGIKANLAVLGSPVSDCDPPVMDFAGWNGLPVQLCTYRESGVSVRTYMLNASPDQRARWIVNACLDIQAVSTKACANKLFESIKTASSGGVFPVAGFIPEPASAAGGTGHKILCLLFRDGVTVAVKNIDAPAAVNNQCHFGDDINDRPVTKVKKYARIASTTREEYLACSGKPKSTVDGLKWIVVVRDLYQKAWTSDRNQLITAKAHALAGTVATKNCM